MFDDNGVKIAAIWASALVLTISSVAGFMALTRIYAPAKPATAMDIIQRCADSPETRSSQFCANALAQLKKE